MGIHGHEDKQLRTRGELRAFFMNESDLLRDIKNRWRNDTQRADYDPFGATLTEPEWEKEWEQVVDLTSLISIPGTTNYRWLESVHIQAMSFISGRAIIVFGNSTLPDGAENRVRGIYLPFGVREQERIYHPICISYSGNHFESLVFIQEPQVKEIPLFDSQQEMLPIRFCEELTAGEVVQPNFAWLQVPDILQGPKFILGVKERRHKKCLYFFHPTQGSFFPGTTPQRKMLREAR